MSFVPVIVPVGDMESHFPFELPTCRDLLTLAVLTLFWAACLGAGFYFVKGADWLCAMPIVNGAFIMLIGLYVSLISMVLRLAFR